jgi:hypothetical protein
MAVEMAIFMVGSPLKQYNGLTRKCHATCHYSYNLPLCSIIFKETMNKLLFLKVDSDGRILHFDENYCKIIKDITIGSDFLIL